ncbi:MAG: NAD(P)/FAD-dependent oxidoreductase [bacterium]
MTAQDIRIAGAGLAGMTAAINLALAGYRPVVYELRKDVGMRSAGDFQYFENWTRPEDMLYFLRSINIKLDFPITPVKAATALDVHRRQYHFRSDRPLGYMIRRGCFEDTLDLALKRQAMRLGVRFEFGRKATSKEVDIVATGPDNQISYVLIHGVTFDTDLRDTIWLLFDQQVAPKVYAYLVAHGGRGVACACFRRRARGTAHKEDYLMRAVDAFQTISKFTIKNRHRFGNYGITPLIDDFKKPIVGEAAGFQDANWGFGMHHAVESGYLAAVSIIEGRDHWRMVRQKIIPWVESSWVNRYIIEKFGDRGYEWLLRILCKRQSSHVDLNRIYSPHVWKSLLARTMCHDQKRSYLIMEVRVEQGVFSFFGAKSKVAFRNRKLTLMNSADLESKKAERYKLTSKLLIKASALGITLKNLVYNVEEVVDLNKGLVSQVLKQRNGGYFHLRLIDD